MVILFSLVEGFEIARYHLFIQVLEPIFLGFEPGEYFWLFGWPDLRESMDLSKVSEPFGQFFK
jgi:hypothetical protein